VYVAPRPDILFGDIFEASYLFDVALHDDAARLTSSEFPPKAPIQGPFYAPPSEKLRLAGDVVLAHGQTWREKPGRKNRDSFDLPGRALLLSDDCHVPTARGDRPDRSDAGRGRLLFAIVAAASAEEIAAAQARVNYNRFALPPAELLPDGGIAELQRLFSVRARDVQPEHRLAALDADGRRALDVRWNAFAARRGPEAAKQNANKLAYLLAGSEGPTPEDAQAGQSVWELLDFAWDIEGSTMRAVSDAYESGVARDEATDRVVEDLRALSLLATQAADRIDARRRAAA
jgi:hypothetical protein